MGTMVELRDRELMLMCINLTLTCRLLKFSSVSKMSECGVSRLNDYEALLPW